MQSNRAPAPPALPSLRSPSGLSHTGSPLFSLNSTSNYADSRANFGPATQRLIKHASERRSAAGSFPAASSNNHARLYTLSHPGDRPATRPTNHTRFNAVTTSTSNIVSSLNNTASRHSRSDSGSSGRPSFWKRLTGQCAEELSGSLISTPDNFQHHVNVKYDKSTQKFKGLPLEWEKEVNKTFGVALINAQTVPVPGFDRHIPAVLVLMRSELERTNGLDREGIFRVSANSQLVVQYQMQLDSGQFQRLDNNEDNICMASLIKAWFRQLPVALLAPLGRDDILGASMATSAKETTSLIFGKLLEPNRSVFLWLLDLLADVVAHESVNRMGPKALAVVIAPNLYTIPDDIAPNEMMTLMDASVTALQMCLEDTVKSKTIVPVACTPNICCE